MEGTTAPPPLLEAATGVGPVADDDDSNAIGSRMHWIVDDTRTTKHSNSNSAPAA